MTGQLTHFEIYGDQPTPLVEFYSSLFRWKFEKAPGVDYWRILGGARNGNDCHGGLTYRPDHGPRCWLQYVTVNSVDGALAHAECLGANIVRPKTAVPKTGWYAVLADPQGNPFAIWQSDPTAFPQFEPE